MHTLKRQSESLALPALLALCLHVAAAAIGGHLCGGLSFVSQANLCAGDCCAEAGLAPGLSDSAIGPMRRPQPEAPDESPCCVRASIVMVAPPTMQTLERPAAPVAPWLVLTPVAGPGGIASALRGMAHSVHAPRPPAELALVRSSILLI